MIKRTPIKKISDKRKKQLSEYKKKRDAYLLRFKQCQVSDCKKPSSEVHHIKGRENDLLLEELYWMAVCRMCHQRIDNDPNWARENGYSDRGGICKT